MNLEGFPSIPQNLKEQAQTVIDIFDKLRGTDPIGSIEIPTTVEESEEYARKLKIMKKGTIVQFPTEETEHINARIDEYIEKLKEVK